MHWVLILIAGFFEVLFALYLKKSNGVADVTALSLSIFFGIVSLLLMALALKSMPIGIGYAVWTGLGVVGVTLAGYWLYGEDINLQKIICLLLILGGLVGLYLQDI